MKYKILLPVTVLPELVENILKEIPLDKTIIVNNFDDKQVYNLTLQAKDQGAEIYHCPVNLGLKASWNIGLKRIIEDNDDFLIILAPSAIFDKSINYFIDEVIKREQTKPGCRYLASYKALLHCFVQTKRSVELGGYFDENFWPIYMGDSDYCQRAKFNGVNQESFMCTLDDVVHSHEISLSCRSDTRLMNCHISNAYRRNEYYISKWGGEHTYEKFTTPFNNPNWPINHWELQDNFINPLIDSNIKCKPDFHKYLVKL